MSIPLVQTSICWTFWSLASFILEIAKTHFEYLTLKIPKYLYSLKHWSFWNIEAFSFSGFSGLKHCIAVHKLGWGTKLMFREIVWIDIGCYFWIYTHHNHIWWGIWEENSSADYLGCCWLNMSVVTSGSIHRNISIFRPAPENILFTVFNLDFHGD